MTRAQCPDMILKRASARLVALPVTSLRRLPRPARRRKCARSHPRHGRHKTTARRCRSGTLRWNRRAQPGAKWPHRTIRGFGHRCGSIAATYPLLVRAVYTWHSSWSAGRRLPYPPCRQRHCGKLRFIRAVRWLSNAFFTFEIAGSQYDEDTRLTISASC